MATRPARTAAVIGAGPAGLMAAEILAGGGVAVTVYDRMPSVGRKFLMAGRGGLNLTHSEPLPAFLSRYRPRDTPLGAAVARFAPEDLRGWCDGLGQATFVGSSGRVFPRAMKASPLLRAWLGRLAAAQVRILPRHRWTGWAADGALRFATWDGEVLDRPVATVLAMGGASWPQLGSDGEWAALLEEAGLPVAPFEPSNCGFTVPWSSVFLDRFEGQPLKNVAVAFEGCAARGDLVVTRTGLEGGAIYAVSAVLREAIRARGAVEIAVALRPDQTIDALARKLADRSGKPSLATTLRKRLNLPPIAIALLHEAVLSRSRPLNSLEVAEMAALINAVPLRLTGVSPITRAISTAGGLRFAALDGGFMLRHRPGVFAAGEMLDWEAPTGGYLLQGCFASGAAAGQGALAFIDASASAGIPEPERRLGR